MFSHDAEKQELRTEKKTLAGHSIAGAYPAHTLRQRWQVIASLANFVKFVRDLARMNRQNTVSANAIFQAVIHCKKLDKRQIRHRMVTKEQFIGNFHAKGVKRSIKKRTRPRKFKLPKELSKIMGKKTWQSPSPEKAVNGVVAWHWLTREMPLLELTDYNAAWWSKFLMVEGIFGCTSKDELYVCTGKARLGGVGVKLEQAGGVTGKKILKAKCDDIVAIHITDPMDYFFIPCESLGPAMAAQNYDQLNFTELTWRQTATAQPLIKFALSLGFSSSLTYSELELIADALKVERVPGVHEILRVICVALCVDDTEEDRMNFINNVLDVDKRDRDKKKHKKKRM